MKKPCFLCGARGALVARNSIAKTALCMNPTTCYQRRLKKGI